MSLKSKPVKNYNLFEFELDLFELAHAFIPYSKFFKNEDSIDIYSGDEDIPFESKDAEFKRLMLHEFL